MDATNVIAAAKDKLRIPELWLLLGFTGNPKAGTLCCSPFRADRKPSFSISGDGKLWHDFGTGEGGDAISFLAKARGIDNHAAVLQFLELVRSGGSCEPATLYQDQDSQRQKPKPDLAALREGTNPELEQLAKSRNIDFGACWLADQMGILRFGWVAGFPSWIVTDCSGLCAEGRRLDGKPYPAIGELGERKAHTLRGSSKAWPVGILPAPEYRNPSDTIALVEGGPDLLTALHFAFRQKRTDVMPVAILGRNCCQHGLHPESLEYFRERRVRIYPNLDPDGGTIIPTVLLTDQMVRLGCEVDHFFFRRLRKPDGTSPKDLNDCVSVVPEQLQELFP
jgi:hypothetical protein